MLFNVEFLNSPCIWRKLSSFLRPNIVLLMYSHNQPNIILKAPKTHRSAPKFKCIRRASATDTTSTAEVELELDIITVLVDVEAKVAAAVILLAELDVDVLVDVLPTTATSVSVVLVVWASMYVLE
jgi:hypothetical protein